MVKIANALDNLEDIWWLRFNNKLDFYQDLSYGEILAGQPGAWLVKKMFYMQAIKKFQKGPYIEIQNNSQSMLCFYDSLNGL